jgi:hypothetical protein
MTTESDELFYWALDVPGLTADQAKEVASFVADTGISEFASAVDPRAFMTLHLDRVTVRSLLDAVEGRQSHPGNVSDGLAGLREAMKEWLQRAGD